MLQEVKEEFIQDCKSGMGPGELAIKYGIFYDTVYVWKKKLGLNTGPLKPKEITWVVKGDCWVCTSHKPGSTGYPSMRINGKQNLSILKLKYEEKHGKIPKGKCMLHKCDNRKCINPDHVMIGSKGDNCRDRHVKKRDCHGVKSPQHKLNKDRILFARELRESGWYYSEIAYFFGDVSVSTVTDALTGRSWMQTFGGEKNRRCYKSREATGD